MPWTKTCQNCALYAPPTGDETSGHCHYEAPPAITRLYALIRRELGHVKHSAFVRQWEEVATDFSCSNFEPIEVQDTQDVGALTDLIRPDDVLRLDETPIAIWQMMDERDTGRYGVETLAEGKQIHSITQHFNITVEANPRLQIITTAVLF